MALAAVKVCEYGLFNAPLGKVAGLMPMATVAQLRLAFTTLPLMAAPDAGATLHNCPAGALRTLILQLAP